MCLTDIWHFKTSKCLIDRVEVGMVMVGVMVGMTVEEVVVGMTLEGEVAGMIVVMMLELTPC